MAKQEPTTEQFVDELMGFDPTQVAAFNEPENKSTGNANQYKTNPLKVDPKIATDGHYHARIRVLYNPHNMNQSIVKNAHYAFTDATGFFMLDSKLAFSDRSCQMFRDWKSLHFDESPEKHTVNGKDYTAKEWGDHMYDKSEEQFVLVQVLEDANQPDLVGKFLGWRLPKAIFDTLQAKMHPTDKSKAPQDLMNYLFGPVLELDVTPGPDDPSKPERKQREIKYTLCSFEADPTPIITVTGEELLTDDERDMVSDYAAAKKTITDPKATAKKKDEAMAKCKALVEPLKALMQKAIDYVKENAINIEDEFGYHEPTQEQWKRYEKWAKLVKEFKDPATYVEPTTEAPANNPGNGAASTEAPAPEMPKNPEDDLPF